MSAHLHGKPVCIGDAVYDEIDGWGTVASVTCNCIYVKIGKRSMRKYSFSGYTGRRAKPTLFFNPLPRICLSKDPATATKQRQVIEQAIEMLNCMCPDDPITYEPDGCEEVMCCGDETDSGCCQ